MHNVLYGFFLQGTVYRFMPAMSIVGCRSIAEDHHACWFGILLNCVLGSLQAHKMNTSYSARRQLLFAHPGTSARKDFLGPGRDCGAAALSFPACLVFISFYFVVLLNSFHSIEVLSICKLRSRFDQSYLSGS